MPTDLHWSTPSSARQLIEEHLAAARRAEDPWPDLERAHLLSQPWWWPHTRAHAAMLVVALRTKDRREATGQVVRFLVAGPGSLAGRYPPGNTGRTTMGLTETAAVPAHIAAFLARYVGTDR